LWLHVQDHGQGIASDLLPRIFDPYVSTQFGQGRSGLGLFQAQAQVSKGLKGRLSVKSERGQGACFAIEWVQLALTTANALP
jgi:signal transduction histidine kinase